MFVAKMPRIFRIIRCSSKLTKRHRMFFSKERLLRILPFNGVNATYRIYQTSAHCILLKIKKLPLKHLSNTCAVLQRHIVKSVMKYAAHTEIGYL